MIAYSQFTGKLIDAKTNRPIANATITSQDVEGVTSLQNGTFEVLLQDYPAVIKVSHSLKI